jgi:hypothetical protein
MTMDIELATGIADRCLVLRACRPYGKGDFGCLLSVRSGYFGADIDFYFERYALESFVTELQSLNASLKGRAQLKPEHEDPYIQFEGDGLGHIKVSGKLLQLGPDFQTLEFEFRADQTCLTPFIDALQNLAAEHVA